jgi:hypothetical protein
MSDIKVMYKNQFGMVLPMPSARLLARQCETARLPVTMYTLPIYSDNSKFVPSTASSSTTDDKEDKHECEYGNKNGTPRNSTSSSLPTTRKRTAAPDAITASSPTPSKLRHLRSNIFSSKPRGSATPPPLSSRLADARVAKPLKPIFCVFETNVCLAT